LFQLVKDTLLKIFLLLLICFGISLTASAGTYNYADIGFGISKISSSTDNEEIDDDVDKLDLIGAFKVATGSRIGRSLHTWFELSYIYQEPRKIVESEVTNHYFLAGLKFTTDPKADLSTFFKLSGGKVFSKLSQPSGASGASSDSAMVYSGSLGTSFRLNKKQSINFEVQSIFSEIETGSLYNNFFIVSLNQFL
jgi:hypothetical protein